MMVLLALTVGVIAQETPKVKTGPAPEWVRPVVFAPSTIESVEDSDGSTLYYLQDEQMKADENAGYYHYAMQFLTKGAVEDSSQITVSVNPAYQELTFNTLLIHRDGKVLDRLGKQEIKLLQRESRLDWNLFDGRLSAVVILDDIRVGDVVEYAYTLKGANPVFGRHFMDAFYLQWSEPVRHLSYRLLWPTARYLGIRNHRAQGEPKVTCLSDTLSEYRWERKDVAGLSSDGNLPSWYDPWGWVQLTEYKSWNEVARWADAIYPKAEVMPEELAAELKSTAELKDPKAQVIRALQYVQDNIRYLGIEVGPNSHEPHPIDVVLGQRFGDCKDKALLLSTMLRQLGFDAYPALVSTDTQSSVKDWLPSPLAFNHVIVQLELDGRTYWMDPTRRNQGQDLDQLYFPAYGYALVIRPETQALTEIKAGGYEVTSSKITEVYEFKDFSGELSLKVLSVLSGGEADRMRAYISDTRRAEIQKTYLNFYARQFPDIESISPPRFADDRKKNVITVEEQYRITNFWLAGDDKDTLVGDFSASSVQNLMQRPASPVRSMPMALRYPSQATHTIEIQFPRAMALSKEKTQVDDPAFKFSYTAEPLGNKTTLKYEYETKADHVSPGAINAYLAKVEIMRNLLGYQLTIPSSWAKAATVGKVAEKEPGPSAVATSKREGVAGWGLIAFLVVFSGGWLAYWWFSGRTPAVVVPSIPLHHCAECGATENTDHALEFRVAGDGHEYCTRHLKGRG